MAGLDRMPGECLRTGRASARELLASIVTTPVRGGMIQQ
jgi:hypothetical protein